MTRVIPFANAAAAYGATSNLQRTKLMSTKMTTASVREIGITSPVDRLDLSAAIKKAQMPTHPLAAAKVSQTIDLDSIPGPAGSAANSVALKPTTTMPFYTNPALRNVAATRLAQGDTLDIQA